ncbi:hypothetical protein BDZ89DRAFT_1166544 [Hymenopellis radicata]|nr:hypothetical protein BDZ89DRAFT_1166544 [Hymenopellis radicata]
MATRSLLKPIKTRGGPSHQWTIYACPFNRCPIVFPHERQIQDHMNVDHARDFSMAHVCCGRAFLVHDLRAHQQTEHDHQMNGYAYAKPSARGEKPMKHACYSKGCTAVYDSRDELEEHMKMHRDYRRKSNRSYHPSTSSSKVKSPQVEASVGYYPDARK